MPPNPETPGRIQKAEPPTLDSDSSMVQIAKPKVDSLFGSAQGSGSEQVAAQGRAAAAGPDAPGGGRKGPLPSTGGSGVYREAATSTAYKSYRVFVRVW